MRKQVLVIGGTYFAGRVFSILTSRGDSGRDDLHLHIVNRGKYPLKSLDNITQYVCDRHDTSKLAEVLPKGVVFDAVVDFCAYEPGDISSVINALPGRIRQYIFISTSSVYVPGGEEPIDETAPVLSDFSSGRVEDYIAKKCLLENELTETCASSGIAYTILRPAFIYGPFNYAPRESYFIKLIAENKPVPVPTDATGRFSFVYVFDVSDIINRCIGNEKAYNEVFNLASPEIADYNSFISQLRQCNGTDFPTTPVTVKQVIEQNIPLPFPLDESLLYSGKKSETVLEYKYTPFSVGMKKTFSIFMSIYKG